MTAQTFTMRGTDLVSAGQTMVPLALADHLWLHAKVYQGGGENSLHYHPAEDHAFFVLAGSATFFDDVGGTTAVGAMDGIMIPKGTRYRFEADPGDNLVLLRIGASPDGGGRQNGPYPAALDRRRPSGEPFPGDHPDNGTSALPTVLSAQRFGSPTTPADH